MREWKKDELDQLEKFLSDEKVMYAYEGAFNKEQVKEWLNWNLLLYEKKGYGLWAIERKSDGVVLGECGLTDQVVDAHPYIEIGYHLCYQYWKQGYMSEAAQAVKNYVFTVLNVQEVVSCIRDTNIYSMNVAIRNEMIVSKRFIKRYKGIEMPHYLFKASNPK